MKNKIRVALRNYILITDSLSEVFRKVSKLRTYTVGTHKTFSFLPDAAKVFNRPVLRSIAIENRQAGLVEVHHGQIRSHHEIQERLLHIPNACHPGPPHDGSGRPRNTQTSEDDPAGNGRVLPDTSKLSFP